MPYILDAHTLLWYLTADKKLSKRIRDTLDATNDDLLIPAIALAETGRIIISHSDGQHKFDELLKAIDQDPRFRIIAIDRQIVETALRLQPLLELHDSLIVATAIVLNTRGINAILLTRDEEITNSKLTPTLW
jgi:PIN domain nuclease of toxin-antitoxin system